MRKESQLLFGLHKVMFEKSRSNWDEMQTDRERIISGLNHGCNHISEDLRVHFTHPPSPKYTPSSFLTLE